MAQEPKTSKIEAKQITLEFNKTVWIDTASTSNEHSHQKSSELGEDFKKEHQQYLASKMQQRKKERETKRQEFGPDSSSDEEMPRRLPSNSSESTQHKVDTKPPKSQTQLSVKSQSPERYQKEPMQQAKITSGKKLEREDRVSIMVGSKKGVDVWLSDTTVLTDKVMVLPNLECTYYDISKLKLIFTDIGDRCFKIKVNWKSQEVLFGASHHKQHNDIPEVFYIFARTIHAKLSLMGRKPLTPAEPNRAGVPEAIIKNSFIFGKLLKKSRVISRWTETFAVINREGLTYYKKLNEKGDLLVPRASIKQLWTRFQLQENWLIVKLFQGSHKIELGIPIQDELSARSWLFHIYNLIFKG